MLSLQDQGFEDLLRTPDLIERGDGVAEGMPVADFHASYDDGTPIPGAETPQQLIHRSLSALTELVTKQSGTPTVAVTHGGVISELLAHASAGIIERVRNGSVTLVHMTDTGLILASDQ